MGDHDAELKHVGNTISDELRMHTFSERLQWLEKARTNGNELIKQN